MVKPKIVKFSDEKPSSAPCSPTPRCFREPEGMTDIDLRRLSEMSAFSDASFKKFDRAKARRTLCKALLIVGCVGSMMGLLLLLFATGRNTSLQQLFHVARYQEEANAADELVAYYMEKLSRCKRDRSLEACCAIISDFGGELHDCSVERIIAAIEQHELQLFAKDSTTSGNKRDEMDYIPPDTIENILRKSYILINSDAHDDIVKGDPRPRAKEIANRPEIHPYFETDSFVSRPKRQLQMPEYFHPVPNFPPDHNFQFMYGPHYEQPPEMQSKDSPVYREPLQPPPPSGQNFFPSGTIQKPIKQPVNHGARQGPMPIPPHNIGTSQAELHNSEHKRLPIRPTNARPLEHSQRLFETGSNMRKTMLPQGVPKLRHNNHDYQIHSNVPSYTQPEIIINPRPPNIPMPQVHAPKPHQAAPASKMTIPLPKLPLSNADLNNAKLEPIHESKTSLRLPQVPFIENNETDTRNVKDPVLKSPSVAASEVRQNNDPKLAQFANHPGNMLVNHGTSLQAGFTQPSTPCFATFTPPSVGSPLSLIQQQVPMQYDPAPKFAQLVPISVPRNPSNPYLINAGYTYFAPQPIITNMNAPIQPGNGGISPYYICNPLPAQSSPNNIAGMAGVEVRNSDDNHLHMLSSQRTSDQRALTRQSDMCSVGQEMCADNSKCISSARVCDDTVNCDDGSDEAYCSCKLRISPARACDAYLDCPHGEDEIACRGCTAGTFNCDDWTAVRDATCIPLNQRCDGIPHCPTGKDEQDCSVLLDVVDESTDVFKVSNSEGFLHRNHRGRWYPVCSDGEDWAQEICRTEMDTGHRPALVQQIPINYPYEGSFVSRGPDGRVHLLDDCADNMALHAQCPPPICGIRKIVSNPYREEEVDTSEEEILAQFRTARDVNNNDTTVGNGRVVGGKACQPAAWPWVVSIYRNGAFHCGGALITDAWLITAAHCVDKYWHFYYEIELGMLRRFSYSPMQQTRFASDIVAHAGYDRANLKNDLALMRMNAPVRYNRYVRPICLPTEITAGKDYAEAPPANALCTAVGWGATAEHGTDPDHLRQVEVPVLRYCKHKQDAEGNEICAGLLQGGKDACQGDSGGPFLCRNPNMPDQWYLAGIVSHGEGCARPDEPGVYTRVSMYLDWIYDHTKDEVLPQRRPLHRCPGYTCKGIRKCIPMKRRCDRVVDCLYGDDEAECDNRNSFSSLFKQALDLMAFRGRGATNDDAIATPTTNVSIISDRNKFISKPPEDNTNGTTDNTIVAATAREKERFLCEKMLQVIPVSKKCDKVIDCQDGSDESSCTCADYLKLTHADALCDGTADCMDMSDEKDCAPACSDSSEFYCRLSKACIPISRRCDSTPDCLHSEDEWDCFALTANYRMRLDADDRPLVNTKGMLSYYAAGEWRPLCGNFTRAEGGLAADVCISLGLTDYERFLQLQVKNTTLPTVSTDNTMRHNSSETTTTTMTCNGFFVQCANTTSTTTTQHVGREDKLNALGEVALAPWSAAIYADGVFQCTGVLLNFNWLLTSIHCFSGILKPDENYLAVRLGGGRGYLNVQGPHEQIISVLQRIRVAATDAVVLELAHPITFSRYVKPLHLRKKGDFIHYREKCFAMGRVNETTTMLRLDARRNCTQRSRCFTRHVADDRRASECKVRESWSGCIVCDAGNGFYPAAIFKEPLGSCGFNGSRPYLSVSSVTHDIFQAMDRTPFVVAAPKCEGHRCPLGKCLPSAKVCDGIRQCEDGSDEESQLCEQRSIACHLHDTCVCAPDELRCTNTKCVKKYKFCDRTDDCGDGSDEPTTCSCREFLNLISPAKICDGVRNCKDRSDEDPNLCSCRPGLFKCSNTSQCVSQEMVCDGYEDCTDGSDEKQCVSLKASEEDRQAGEVMTRTAGVWHSGCFPQHMTTSELENVCETLGFTGSSAAYWKVVNVNDTAPQPKTEKFDHFWVHNTEQTGKLMLAMRSGLNNFVSFLPSTLCFKLFIKCI